MIIVTQDQLRNKDTEACSSSFPDGKTQRRERRAKAIRRRKGRL